MTLEVHRSAKSRHLVFRFAAGALLPQAMNEALRVEQVACGWLRASGVLEQVDLRAFEPQAGAPAPPRRIAGPVHAIALEGAIGLTDGKPTTSLRALLARETDRGLESLAGEIVQARTVAVEAIVTCLDDLALERQSDPVAGVWLLGAAAARLEATATRAPTQPGWSAAVQASAQSTDVAVRGRPSPAAQPGPGAAIPQRIVRPVPDLDAPVPEAGDLVDHFAFGRCEVLKSDGDRLHLRVHKDGRIREIALEMLRVTRLAEDASENAARFKLDRRM